MARFIAAFAAAAALAMTGTASAGSVISNDMSRCSAGQGPAVKVVVQGIKSSTGKMRVQSYPATKAAWLTKGRWLQSHRNRRPRRHDELLPAGGVRQAIMPSRCATTKMVMAAPTSRPMVAGFRTIRRSMSSTWASRRSEKSAFTWVPASRRYHQHEIYVRFRGYLALVALLSNPHSTGNKSLLPQVRSFCAKNPDIFHYEVEESRPDCPRT
jgi:hypothetical protein